MVSRRTQKRTNARFRPVGRSGSGESATAPSSSRNKEPVRGIVVRCSFDNFDEKDVVATADTGRRGGRRDRPCACPRSSSQIDVTKDEQVGPYSYDDDDDDDVSITELPELPRNRLGSSGGASSSRWANSSSRMPGLADLSRSDMSCSYIWQDESESGDAIFDERWANASFNTSSRFPGRRL